MTYAEARVPEIGELVRERFTDGKKLGRVVWVHPNKWFYIVEFETKTKGVKLQQSYPTIGKNYGESYRE